MIDPLNLKTPIGLWVKHGGDVTALGNSLTTFLLQRVGGSYSFIHRRL